MVFVITHRMVDSGVVNCYHIDHLTQLQIDVVVVVVVVVAVGYCCWYYYCCYWYCYYYFHQ